MTTLMGCPSMVTVVHIVPTVSAGTFLFTIVCLFQCFDSHGHGVAGTALWAQLTIIDNKECIQFLKGIVCFHNQTFFSIL